jgi:lipopolysaccharide transport system ATP-binding protein
VRLAFSVAAHLQPEVMIVDEVLAVGDVAFQQKCLGKMEDASVEGRTVIFVSHNMAAVSHLCPRAILLDNGGIVADGDTDDVVRQYLATAVDSDAVVLADRADRRGSGILRATSLAMRAAEAGGAPRTGDATEIEIAYEAAAGAKLENVAVVLGLDTVYGQRVTTLDTEMTGTTFGELASEGVLSCSIPALTLNEGRYHVTVYITVNGLIADWVIKAGILTVHTGDFFDSGRSLEPHDGLVVVDHTWRAR